MSARRKAAAPRRKKPAPAAASAAKRASRKRRDAPPAAPKRQPRPAGADSPRSPASQDSATGATRKKTPARKTGATKAARKRAPGAPAPAAPVYTGTPNALNAEQIAGKLQEISALLEILGENTFKVRAYENAARVLPGLGDELVAAIQNDELEKVRGIGRGIADRIVALAYTGASAYYDELKSRVPPGLLEMLRIPGLGPKKVKLLFDSMEIASVEALEAACRSDALKDLRGFGEKTQENILRGIAYLRRVSARFFWSVAYGHARPVFESLRAHPATQRAEMAGSLRRRKETVHDVDIVVSTKDPRAITEHFASGAWVDRVIGSGPTKTSILHSSGLQIDLRVVSDEQYPYAMHHFTGSKMHNVAMRGRAQRMGIKINEYGLFRGEDLIECATEEDIFAALGLQYVPPELREDEGEIEAAEEQALPTRLLEAADVRGAFHVHTTSSDGRDDLETLVRTARELGWQYIGITDHARADGVPGLDAEQAEAQRLEVATLQQRVTGIRIFQGLEVGVRDDGSLCAGEELLSRFDFVIASVHDDCGLSRDAQTRRVLRAAENPWTTMLGHPTARLLFERPALDLDLGAVFDAAARSGVLIEINGQPKRMDPDGSQVRAARDKGVQLCVNPDAHAAAALADVDLAVGLARRGWLGPEHVFNTRDARSVAEHFDARKGRKA